MIKVNMLRTRQTMEAPYNFTTGLIVQIFIVFALVGVGTGYTFAELNQFNANIYNMLRMRLEPKPVKLPRIKTDVNVLIRYSKTV